MKEESLLWRISRDFLIVVGVISWLGWTILINTDLCIILFLASLVSFVAFFCMLISKIAVEVTSREMQEHRHNECRSCHNEQSISPEVPFCKSCLEAGLKEVAELADETEKKIKLAKELGLDKQAQGAKKLFSENLPEPIKWFFQQEALVHLKQCFPQAKPFNPSGFVRFPLNIDNPEVNIPVEGLELLKRAVQSNRLLSEISQ